MFGSAARGCARRALNVRCITTESVEVRDIDEIKGVLSSRRTHSVWGDLPRLPALEDPKLLEAIFPKLTNKTITQGDKAYHSQLSRKGKVEFQLILTEYLVTRYPLYPKAVLNSVRNKVFGKVLDRFEQLYFQPLFDHASSNLNHFYPYIGALFEDAAIRQETITKFITALYTKFIEEEIVIANIEMKVNNTAAEQYRQIRNEMKIKEFQQKFLLSTSCQEKLTYTVTEDDIRNAVGKLNELMPSGVKPVYEVIFCAPMDSDPNHNTFDVQCIVNDEVIGFGAHVKLGKARNAAAYDALLNNRPKVVHYIKHLPSFIELDLL